MKKFLFKLNPVLKLRKNERDIRQQLLTDVLRVDGNLVDRRRQIEAERDGLIVELRALGSEGSDIDVDASTARRHYAVQLAGTMGEIDARRAALAGKIEQCRQALVRADQRVKALEKLAEKQETEFIFQQERLEFRGLEETWQAIHAGEHNQQISSGASFLGKMEMGTDSKNNPDSGAADSVFTQNGSVIIGIGNSSISVANITGVALPSQ